MSTQAKSNLIDSLRSTRFELIRDGAALSLMLLWSQSPASKLKGLPSFRDASAEYILSDPAKVARALVPKIADEFVSDLAGYSSSELENLRRAIMNALDSNLLPGDIADAILELCTPYAWVTKESSTLLIAALDSTKRVRVRCAFTYAMHSAWDLSKDVTVDLDVEDRSIAHILSILAAATGRSLNVRIATIDSVAHTGGDSGEADHALIFPPIGMRLRLTQTSSNGTSEQVSSEAFGALWGARAGKGKNIVVVGNGFLFRTTSKDAALKQELIHDHGLEAIISLPRGTLPGTSVSMSALIFLGRERAQSVPQHVTFIDGSDPEALSAELLRDILSSKAKHPLCARPSVKELSEAGFNLSVDRYVIDAEERHSREVLNRQQLVTLSDLADIRRPQALPRESGKESTFEVREALLADIDNGQLSLPGKLSELPRSAGTKIESSVLKPGDILLSIKGTIGKTALVTDATLSESSPTPIVPGQSLVIIRLRKGSAIRDPRTLVSYLRSPIAQSILSSMAGGTTIPNVAMGELKTMAVPIPSIEAQEKLLKKFDEYTGILRDIDELQKKMKSTEEEMFNITLSGPASQPAQKHWASRELDLDEPGEIAMPKIVGRDVDL